MQPAVEFAPTCLDPAGLVPENRRDWLVANVTRNRDSEALTQSNWNAALRRLGGEGRDVEVHRFRHWGVGWLEIIIVRPGTAAAEELRRIEEDLRRYPVLDEQDLSTREHEEYLENWRLWGADDFARTLAGMVEDEGLRECLEDADPDELRRLFEDHGGGHEHGRPLAAETARRLSRDDVMAICERLGEANPSSPSP